MEFFRFNPYSLFVVYWALCSVSIGISAFMRERSSDDVHSMMSIDGVSAADLDVDTQSFANFHDLQMTPLRRNVENGGVAKGIAKRQTPRNLTCVDSCDCTTADNETLPEYSFDSPFVDCQLL